LAFFRISAMSHATLYRHVSHVFRIESYLQLEYSGLSYTVYHDLSR